MGSLGCLYINSEVKTFSKRYLELSKTIDRGMEQLETDFNIKNFITNIRLNKMKGEQNKEIALSNNHADHN